MRRRRSTSFAAAPLAILALFGLAGCSSLTRPSGPSDTEVAELKRRVVELQQRATVGEVEMARLKQEVERLEGELAAARAAAATPAREPAGQAVGRIVDDPLPLDQEVVVDSAIDEEDLEIEEIELRIEEPAATPPPVAEVRQPPTVAEAPPAQRQVERVDPAQELYDEAYTLFHQKRYAEAEASFRLFLERHARSDLADNAQFWIGESRFARGDFSSALAAFTTTVQSYPAGNKVPDALLKAGKCLGALGDRARARQTYREVKERFPGTAAAAIAADLLENGG